jgi:hypothetical protein
MTSINAIVANEHRADLHRYAAERRRRTESPAPRSSTRSQIIALRLAQADERPAVRRLAALDDAPELAGDVLLALVNGEPVAALSLADGRIVADPFRFTEEAVGLLRLRFQHLSGEARRGRWTVARSRLTRRHVGRPTPVT